MIKHNNLLAVLIQEEVNANRLIIPDYLLSAYVIYCLTTQKLYNYQTYETRQDDSVKRDFSTESPYDINKTFKSIKSYSVSCFQKQEDNLILELYRINIENNKVSSVENSNKTYSLTGFFKRRLDFDAYMFYDFWTLKLLPVTEDLLNNTKERHWKSCLRNLKLLTNKI